MTVQELIEALQKLNAPDMQVYFLEVADRNFYHQINNLSIDGHYAYDDIVVLESY